MRKQNLTIWLACGLLVALELIWGAPSLDMTCGRDQGIYALTASRVLNGERLYADVFAFKPPATPWMHVLAQAIFGPSCVSIRALDLLWNVATIMALFGLSIQLLKHPVVAAIPAAAYSYTYRGLDYWHQSQTDGWANLPVVCALLLIIFASRNRSHRALLFTAGAMLGVAFVFKYTFGVFLLLSAALVSRSKNWRAKTSVLCVGFALPIAISGVVLALQGSLGALWETQLAIVFPYTGTLDLKATPFLYRFSYSLYRFHVTIEQIVGLFAWLVPFSLVGLLLLSLQRRNELAIFATAWVAVGAISVFAQGKYFLYHLIPLIPATGFAATLLLQQIYMLIRKKSIANTLKGSFALSPRQFATMFAAALMATTVFLAINLPAAQAREGENALAMSADPSSDSSAADNYRLAKFIETSTSPHDKVFLWGYEPLVYFWAHRESNSRFIYSLPVIAPWAPQAYRDELLSDLVSGPPRYFIVQEGDRVPHVLSTNEDSVETLNRFTTLHEWVLANYTYVGIQANRFHVYERREPPK
jgi:4-amino-4-deoxy-L-arabinose transferase-like glycosyltransferase